MIEHNHYITRCKVCFDVIYQCKCDDPDDLRPTYWSICLGCESKQFDRMKKNNDAKQN